MNKYSRFLKPEVFFLFTSLFLGIAYSIVIPYGAGFDEETHLVRIFDISGGNLIPNRPISAGNYTFSEFYSLSYQRRPIQTPASDLFSTQIINQKPNWQNMSSGHTESTYLPFMFFPEAIVAGIGWRVFNFPLIPVIILMRIIGLFTYVGLSYLSIRLLPAGKWVLTVLLLAPIALFQASTLNGDHFTIAASALFIAYLIKLLSKDKPISNKEALHLSILVILIGLTKPGTIILLPALLLIFWRKYSSKFSPLIIILSTIFAIGISIYWSSIAVLYTTYLPSGATRADQIKLIMSNFSDFIRVYFLGSIQLLPRFFTDWVAEYGYWVGKVPWPVFFFFVFSLTLAFITEGKSNILNKTQRVVLSFLGLVCLGIMASIKMIWNYDPGGTVLDTQGRYFLPFAPLVLLSFVGLFRISPTWQKRAIVGSITCLLVSLAFYSYGIYRTYYTTCVFAVDSNHPCVLPVYRNLETNNPNPVPLGLDKVISQTFEPECNSIRAIKVYVLRNDQEQGYLTLNLLDKNNQIVDTSEIYLKSIENQKNISFNFPETPVNPGEQYMFSMQIISVPSAVIELWGVHQNVYPFGEFLINNSPDPAVSDLYFKYECSKK